MLAAILALPGGKILTLVFGDEQMFKIDISEDGQLGYHPTHCQLFLSKLVAALVASGGLIIRQFLPLKVEHQLADGRIVWLPRKNIYGVTLGGGRWQALSGEETRQAHTTDANTGEPFDQEDLTAFPEFPSERGS